MSRSKCMIIFLSLLLVVALVQPLFAQNDCGAILQQGIFNSIITQQQKSVTDNLLEWLIRVDWGTFSQKQNSGLNIGFPIYGVPITISGSHTQDEFNQWQSAVNQGRYRTLPL